MFQKIFQLLFHEGISFSFKILWTGYKNAQDVKKDSVPLDTKPDRKGAVPEWLCSKEGTGKIENGDIADKV